MAIVTSGPYVGFSGTVDGITYYTLRDGRTCAKKKNKKRTTKATQKQRANENDTKLMSELRAFGKVAKTGFRNESEKTGLNCHNALIKNNPRKVILTGSGMDRRLDFSKVQLSKGALKLPHELDITIDENGAQYFWSTEIIPGETHHTDQVMMMAYFPKVKEVVAITGGAQRHLGTDILYLQGIERGQVGEFYIAFISGDHTRVANSIYLGQLIW